ncbi:uncharacterized protein J8A68_006015 [[Candida] subhashii]|uniref:Uncharacterized protein n=1 Tax=[Candida] subhashii TaxID=561895 RepID=A0A8J5QB93_9ASCO|nr:uncharacterized protein J8A68_006015 [[Candida] subhashii]KAG7660477.1 hypothetical protein J8A68_006015 [[Candida] subhashii]
MSNNQHHQNSSQEYDPRKDKDLTPAPEETDEKGDVSDELEKMEIEGGTQLAHFEAAEKSTLESWNKARDKGLDTNTSSVPPTTLNKSETDERELVSIDATQSNTPILNEKKQKN